MSTAHDPLVLLEESDSATQRYLEALTALGEDDLRAPSLLPGWTRGHVATHVARNADGLRNLLVWARTGVETPQYLSWEQRNLDIDSGAGRRSEELVEDNRSSAERFRQEASQLTGDQWDVPVRTLSSPRMFPARLVLRSRLIEVEVHHADLGIGYRAADWPAGFTAMLLERLEGDRAKGPAVVLSATDTGGRWRFGSRPGADVPGRVSEATGSVPEVTGSAADLAWWSLGRGDGAGLVCSAGDLPELGRWR
jgi:maleylpyruvate isomerase